MIAETACREVAAPCQSSYDNAFLSGAICPVHGTGAALALPTVDNDPSTALREMSLRRPRHTAPKSRRASDQSSRTRQYSRIPRRARADVGSRPARHSVDRSDQATLDHPSDHLALVVIELRVSTRRRFAREASHHTPTRLST